MSILALDLGGTKLATALLSDEGLILESGAVLIGDRAGGAIGDLIIEQIHRFMSLSKEGVKGIGISVPGISRRNGTVWAPNLGGWDDFPLAKLVSDEFLGIAVAIDSDRACSILGEVWRGNAHQCRDAVFIAVGTGIGAGILADGRVVRGAGDIAGAVGWLALKKPFMDKYISCGCFEYYASGAGIARYAKDIIEMRPDYKGTLRHQSELTAHHVFEARLEGDAVAEEVFRECVSLWGMAAANLVSIFNPEKVIFGGGVFGPAVPLIPEIYEEAKKWSQPISICETNFEPSALGGQAALFGAGYMALTKV